jgi:chromosome partitioning protein
MGRAVTGASVVMKGLLSEFTLAEVLQVVSLSRQFTAIELHGLDGRHCGVIWIKSGHVIDAQSGSAQGRSAFYELFQPTADTFVVFRLADPPRFNTPIGRLPELLLEAVDASRRSEGSRPSLRPVAEQAVPAPRPLRASSASPVARPGSSGGATGTTPPPRPLSVVPRTRKTAPSRAPGGLIVAVCSPKGGVGKTTIALNLAVSLAQGETKVLLVDADSNGDLLSLLDARGRVKLGAYDILDRPDAIDAALRVTASPNLRMLPACGPELSASVLERGDQGEAWRKLLESAAARADIVLVDCPAGMFGTTHDVLSAATHVIGVLQSEMIAQRSFANFSRGLATIPGERRPQLLGVVVNMFQRRSGPSVEAFQAFGDQADRHRLFETMIPRSEAFAEASLAGQPLRFAEGDAHSPVAWLFDMLADEVTTRSGLRSAAGSSTRTFLV